MGVPNEKPFSTPEFMETKSFSCLGVVNLDYPGLLLFSYSWILSYKFK